MAWTPSIVPAEDQTVYLVLDDFGDAGQAYREADPESSDLESVIEGLLTGQYTNPARIIAFNVSEKWAADVSEDVAREIQLRCDLQLHDVPSPAQAFVERHTDRDQISLRLASP